MMSLSDDKQDDNFGTFNIPSRYVNDILNIYYIYSTIYPADPQL